MLVENVDVVLDNDMVRAEACLQFETKAKFSTGNRSETLWFEWPAAYFKPMSMGVEPFALVALTLAMSVGENLRIEGEVDTNFYLNLLEAAEIYQWYFPDQTHPIEIDCRCISKAPAQSGRVGTFYSGGVDSTFNIADFKRMNAQFGLPRVTDLWLVHGMDIALSDSDLFDKTLEHLSGMASKEGLEIITLKTNARELQSRLLKWTSLGFSVILGAVAKLFADFVPTALIGSYGHYSESMPHASSPLIDPMWSCSRQLIRHHSARFTRLEKLQIIASDAPEMLSGLRVCWKNTGGAYNCSQCEKCLRTLSELRLSGCIDKVESFRYEDLIEKLKKFRLSDKEIATGYVLGFWQKVYQAADEQYDNDLKAAIEPLLRHGVWRRNLLDAKGLVRKILKGR